ncbi:mediator complex subunit 13 C-terminal-domain-containing protein [Schizophyllum fasciatum]
MAAKPIPSSSSAPATATAAATTTFPPRISYADELLTSAFDLRRTPCLVYCLFASPGAAPDGGCEAVERVRLAILDENGGRGLMDSVLTTVRAGKRSRIYAFRLVARDALEDARAAMAQLTREDLKVAVAPACLALDEVYGAPSASRTTQPPKTIRIILHHFLNAVRTRLVDDVVQQSHRVKRDVQSFKTGFLFGPTLSGQSSAASSEDNWFTGWDLHAATRPLTFVHLDIQLDSRLRLLIQPVFRSTSLRPLPAPSISRHARTSASSSSNLSHDFTPGTPLTLLPHGTPAYFLAEYTPPDSRALDRAFEATFRGLGVSLASMSSDASISSSDFPSHKSTPYIIGWIAVENRHGEPKGLTFVYPRRLCVRATDPARRQLENVPELPGPLQPSPTLANAVPPGMAGGAGSSTLAAHSGASAASAASSAPVSPLPSTASDAVHARVAPSISRQQAGRLFRALSAPEASLGGVAREVSAYVDAVAKERERERERMRAARNSSTSSVPRAAGAGAAPEGASPVGAGFSGAATGGLTPETTPSMGLHGAGLSPAAAYAGATPGGASSFYPSPPGTVPATTVHTVPGVVVSPPAMGAGHLAATASSSNVQVPSLSAQAPPALPGAPVDLSTQFPPQTSTAQTSVWGSIQDAANNAHGSNSAAYSNNNGAYPYLGNMDFSMFEDAGMGAASGSAPQTTVAAPPATTNAPTASTSFGAAAASFGSAAGNGFEASSSGTFDSESSSFGGSSSMDMLAFDMDMSFSDADWNFFDKPGATAAVDAGADSSTAGLPSATDPSTAADAPYSTPDVTMTGTTPSSNVSMPPPPPAPPPFGQQSSFQAATPATPMQQATPAYSSPAVHFDGTGEAHPSELSHTSLDMITPEVLPPSPPQTPGTGVGTNPTKLSAPGRFDPISFAPTHHRADNKYTNAGKFGLGTGLPSPPSDDAPSSPDQHGHTDPTPPPRPAWYVKATDPRIGVVRRLAGVKRKFKGPASPKVKRVALEGYGWQGGVGKCGWEDSDADLDWVREEEPPETEEEDEDEDEEEGEEAADREGGFLSAPNNGMFSRAPSEAPPIPSYLPLGPTLPRTHFKHSLLLPLSAPSPSVDSGGAHHASAACAPTPVSPAALVGASAERSKSLEATAQLVAREAAENGVWAEMWGTCGGNHGDDQGVEALLGGRGPNASDVMVVRELWRAVGVKPMTLGALCGADERAQNEESAMDYHGIKALVKDAGGQRPEGGREGPVSLQPPLLNVAKGNAVLQVLPTALRFWDKLGLGPWAGRKNATVYVLYEGADFAHDQASGKAASTSEVQVQALLACLADVFEARQLGKLIPGNSINNRSAGLFPVRFDSNFRKQLAPLHATLESTLYDSPEDPSSPDTPTTLLLILTPMSLLSLSSLALRHLTAGLLKTFRPALEDGTLLTHMLPEYLLDCRSYTVSAPPFAEVGRVCGDIYERIRQPVSRSVSRAFFTRQRLITRVQAPSSALARIPAKAQVSGAPERALANPSTSSIFSLESGPLSLDAGTLLHVGYQISSSGKWVLCACVDEHGEGWDTRVWLADGDDDADESPGAMEARLVARVWEFTTQFARRAAIDWRLAIARLGVMPHREMEAWTRLLETPPDISPSCTALFCVQHDAPWVFAALSKPSTNLRTPSPRAGAAPGKLAANQVYVDASSAVFSVDVYAGRLPICIPRDAQVRSSAVGERTTDKEQEPSDGDVRDQDDEESEELDTCALLPLRTTALVRTTTAGITAMHVHFMHVRWATVDEAASDTSAQDKGILADVTSSYHRLAVLATTRWRRHTVNPLLPLHLATVEAMRLALDRPDDVTEGSTGDP